MNQNQNTGNRLVLTSRVELDEETQKVSKAFDYPFSGETTTILADPKILPPRSDWSIGVIVGPSGSGKSSLAKMAYGITPNFDWNNGRSIVSQVNQKKLGAAGLNSISAWCRPRNTLSTGEGFRADVAAVLGNNVAIDEFTSVVDRSVAASCCHSLQKFVKKEGIKGLVLISCHKDILEWVQPDWVYFSDTDELSTERIPRRIIHLEVFQVKASLWEIFHKHHYMNSDLNKSSRCFCAFLGEEPVAFCASLAYPSGTVKNAWREHRLVVLPDYQGFGIGKQLSDCIANKFVSEGCRYFSKTAHPALGQYREKSPLWKATSKNRMARKDYKKASKKGVKNFEVHADRICFSHEFVGSVTKNLP